MFCATLRSNFDFQCDAKFAGDALKLRDLAVGKARGPVAEPGANDAVLFCRVEAHQEYDIIGAARPHEILQERRSRAMPSRRSADAAKPAGDESKHGRWGCVEIAPARSPPAGRNRRRRLFRHSSSGWRHRRAGGAPGRPPARVKSAFRHRAAAGIARRKVPPARYRAKPVRPATRRWRCRERFLALFDYPCAAILSQINACAPSLSNSLEDVASRGGTSPPRARTHQA